MKKRPTLSSWPLGRRALRHKDAVFLVANIVNPPNLDHQLFPPTRRPNHRKTGKEKVGGIHGGIMGERHWDLVL